MRSGAGVPPLRPTRNAAANGTVIETTPKAQDQQPLPGLAVQRVGTEVGASSSAETLNRPVQLPVSTDRAVVAL
jgi:hypothetical protein